MSLIFDVPKHVLKPKSAPKVPAPDIPTPEEISANEATISDAESHTSFENGTPLTPPRGTPLTPPNSPDVSKQSKRKRTNGKGTPKRSKQNRMLQILS